MWPGRDDGRSVTCIACGETLPRGDAREYDKLGDRWDRQGKEFEYLCKPCFRGISHLSRDGLEEVLDDVDTGGLTTAEFLARYAAAVERRSGQAERES